MIFVWSNVGEDIFSNTFVFVITCHIEMFLYNLNFFLLLLSFNLREWIFFYIDWTTSILSLKLFTTIKEIHRHLI